MGKYLNKKKCSECGGVCCKRCGCMYLPEDFASMEYEDLLKLINVGNISINIHIFDIFGTSLIYEKYGFYNAATYNKRLWSYYLYLRARNIDGDIIDFFGGENTCSMLSDKGCKYSDNERPSLGLSLIPRKRKGEECVQPAYKYLYEIMYDWIKYQKVLEQIVIKIAGKTSIDLLAEKSKLEPSGYWALYYRNLQDYIHPEDAIKIECELKNIKIQEPINVKKLILR